MVVSFGAVGGVPTTRHPGRSEAECRDRWGVSAFPAQLSIRRAVPGSRYARPGIARPGMTSFPLRKEPRQLLRHLVRQLLREVMPARERPSAHILRPLPPQREHVEAAVHGPVLP